MAGYANRETGYEGAMSATGEAGGKDRFAFGRYWARFQKLLDGSSIIEADRSFTKMLGLDGLDSKTFPDAVSRSGLVSLTARRLGARVHSFDYDPQSVMCTNQSRLRYLPEDPFWGVGRVVGTI